MGLLSSPEPLKQTGSQSEKQYKKARERRWKSRSKGLKSMRRTHPDLVVSEDGNGGGHKPKKIGGLESLRRNGDLGS